MPKVAASHFSSLFSRLIQSSLFIQDDTSEFFPMIPLYKAAKNGKYDLLKFHAFSFLLKMIKAQHYFFTIYCGVLYCCCKLKVCHLPLNH